MTYTLFKVFVPGLLGTGISFTELDWAYQTIPQTHLNGRNLTIHAGRALGGSTVINSMVFVSPLQFCLMSTYDLKVLLT